MTIIKKTGRARLIYTTLVALFVLNFPALVAPFISSSTFGVDRFRFLSVTAQPSRGKSSVNSQNTAPKKPVVEKQPTAGKQPVDDETGTGMETEDQDDFSPSQEENKPTTAQDLIDALLNRDLEFEERFDALSLASQLPKEEYIKVLTAAAKVENSEIATTAIKILIDLNQSSTEMEIEKQVLSLTFEGQNTILISLIERVGLEPSYRLGSLGRTILQQTLSTEIQSSRKNTQTDESTKFSTQLKQQEDRSRAETASLASLLMASSTQALTAEEHALLRSARVKFPKLPPIWLAGSLAKNITKQDVNIGRPIFTNVREYSSLRIAVALALSSLDPQAGRYFKEQIKKVTSEAQKKEQALEKSMDSSQLLQMVKFYNELSYIGWLRFYFGPDAFGLTFQCLNSDNQAVRESGGLVAAKRFPNEFVSFVKNGKSKAKPAFKQNFDGLLSLVTIWEPKYISSIRGILSQGYLIHSTAKIKSEGISGFFDGGTAYLGLD